MYLIFNSAVITYNVFVSKKYNDSDKNRFLFISMLVLFFVILSCKQGSMVGSYNLFGMLILIGMIDGKCRNNTARGASLQARVL